MIKLCMFCYRSCADTCPWAFDKWIAWMQRVGVLWPRYITCGNCCRTRCNCWQTVDPELLDISQSSCTCVDAITIDVLIFWVSSCFNSIHVAYSLLTINRALNKGIRQSDSIEGDCTFGSRSAINKADCRQASTGHGRHLRIVFDSHSAVSCWNTLYIAELGVIASYRANIQWIWAIN